MSNLNNPEGKPALTVVIQSWLTPVIGLVMLVLGLAVGYLVRPMFTPTVTETAVAQLPTVQSPSVNTPVSEATTAPQTAPTTAPTTAAEATAAYVAANELSQIQNQQQFMDFLVSKVTHFKGDENAPVTIIEFSDFQ
jgi:xanthine/uracil permease